MLRRIRDGQPCSIRKHFDAALSLGKLLQKFEAMRMRERFGDGREVGKQRQLWVSS
jgi:hypothetical protein